MTFFRTLLNSKRASRAFGALCLLTMTGCAPALTGEAAWPPQAKKWFERAQASYAAGDLADAKLAVDKAFAELPGEVEVRLLGARIALAELEYERTLELLRQVPGRDAMALRGRAYWYQGDVEKAADELDLLTSDPEVTDPWAKEVAQLARQGRGRRPFEMSGGLLGVSEMPRAGSTSFLVPLEVNGEPSLALISTESTEAAIDSKDGTGAWVSLRFGGRLEVSDVPAVGRDLSGLKRQLGAPVKMLIGVNLLRHLRATIDFAGSQFVVRSYEPPPPPEATTIHPVFYRGGALVMASSFGAEQTSPTALLLVNTAMGYPVALDAAGWTKAGLDPKTFPAVPGGNGLSEGVLPMLRIGAFELPNVPGVLGVPFGEVEKTLGVDLDGVAGSSLFATFRLTFADRGRTMWLEDLPAEVIQARMMAAQRSRGPAPAPASVPGVSP